MTIWVCGTSVSLMSGGYVEQLGCVTSNRVVNLSIGDQDSVMGLARLLQHEEEIRPGDVLLWEFALCDILLNDFYGHDESQYAMGLAWKIASARGANVTAVAITPASNLDEPSDVERRVLKIIKDAGVYLFDLREIFREMEVSNQRTQYMDDRHPFVSSPAMGRLAERLAAFIRENHGNCGEALLPELECRWHWKPARSLMESGGSLRVWENSVVSVEALRIEPHGHRLPLTSRVVRTGVVSTKQSGSLWCGHHLCLPASARLPEAHSLPFLLRLTRMPCVRPKTEAVEAAPPHGYVHGCWADHGQTRTDETAPVDIFGLLLEGPP